MTRKTCANAPGLSRVVLAGCLAGALGGAASADWNQGPKFGGFDPRADDNFGAAISLSGNAAIVGAPGDNFMAFGAGSIHLFRHDGAAWIQQTKIFASDPAEFDAFGAAVAMDGDLAVVGAMGDDDLGDESGAVYVFRYDGSRWREEAKLTAADGFAGDAFGASVAISGDRVVVGAPGSDPAGDGEGVDAGAAYVFRHDGETWVEDAKLVGSDTAPGDAFGRAVAMHADAILVGSPLNDEASADAGAAYVFRYDGEGGWLEETKMLASDGGAADEFGACVALSKDVAVLGAAMQGDLDEGAAYAFRFDGVWMEEAVLANPDADADDHFGASIAISGDVAVIGSPHDDEKDDDSGAAHVFRHRGGVWYDEAKLMATDGAIGDQFGRAIGLVGEIALVGAPLDDDNDTDSGSVYEYDFSPARPAMVGEMPADLFGRAVANAGDVDGDEIDDLLIGAPYNDANGASAGKIYLYSGATLDLIRERVGQRAGDRFGWAVSGAGDVNNDGLADYMVGAPWARSSRGRVYVFSGRDGAVLRVMNGEQRGDRFGYALAGEADIDNDGREDVLIGAPKNDEMGGNAGKVYAFSGRNWRLLGAMHGERKADQFGFALAGLDKANGDGYADFVVGAPKNDDRARNAGKVYVVNGKKLTVLYAVKGRKAGDQFGYSVAGIGNADGDGRSDFVVGSPYYDRGPNANAGRIDVFSGRNGSRLFSRNGENADDRMGHAVAGTDDVDGDGMSDVLVGAPRHDAAGSNAGRVYLRSGANGGLIGMIDGDAAGDMLGWAVAGAGDVDGDERGDLLIAAPFNDAADLNAGQAYLLRSTDELPDADAFSEPADSDDAAHDPADLDGDGTVDAADIAALLAAWGAGDSAADLNGDGVVDEADLMEILDAA